MIESKHIGKFVAAFVALAVAALILTGIFADAAPSVKMAYENSLFDTSQVMEVNIEIGEDDWEELLANATSEEYYSCDITINGSTCKNVGIRAKGNTSLTSVASSGSDRYSLKVQFDEYVSGQTFDGLDKLVLNNNFSDATMMKEALVYDMFAFLGTDASLYNYAKVSVNGEYRGVYLALEAVEESMLMRNFGVSYGEIYKPDNMNFGGAGKMRSVDIEDIRNAFGFGGENGSYTDMYGFRNKFDNNGGSNAVIPDGMDFGQLPYGGMAMPGYGQFPQQYGPSFPDINGMFNGGGANDGLNRRNMGGFNSFGGGTSLNYTDDSLDSYSGIWDASVFDTTDADHKRVVTALKNISEGTNLEEYMDVDNMLRYMAVQTFAVNLDSLTGSMEHNYYLYEDDGKLNILPWDYNLSFGGFGDEASSMINFPIDTPFSGDTADRRFFMSLLENEGYLAKYHEYLSELVGEYINGGGFDSFFTRVRGQIDSLVETDPTSFYTYDQYDAAAQMLYKTVTLRAQSVEGQLDGSIPSTADGQQADPSALIEATDINFETMGVMSSAMKMGGNNRMNNKSEDTATSLNGDNTASGGAQVSPDAGNAPGQAVPGGNMPSNVAPPNGLPSNVAPPNGAPTNVAPPNGKTSDTAVETTAETAANDNSDSGDAKSASPETNASETQDTAETGSVETEGNGFPNLNQGAFSFNMPGALTYADNGITGSGSLGSNSGGAVTLAICFMLMLIAVFFAAIYKRR